MTGPSIVHELLLISYLMAVDIELIFLYILHITSISNWCCAHTDTHVHFGTILIFKEKKYVWNHVTKAV